MIIQSVGEPEVQPLVAHILRVLQILVLLLQAHGIPLLLPRVVAPSVVQPSKDEQTKSKDVDADECAVSAEVLGLVVFAVDVGRNHSAHLHHHIVACRGDGTCPYATGVAGREAYEDGVAVGVAEQDGEEGVCAPCVDRGAGPGTQGDYTR